MKIPANKKSIKPDAKARAEKAIQSGLLNQQSKTEKLVMQLALIVSLVGFILYMNTLGHGYVLDDYSLILENNSTQKGISGIKEIFSTTYRYGYIMVSDELYRPLSKAMFAVEWALSPNNAKPGHWINVLLYALTGYFLMLTLFRYFKSVPFSFIAALLFIAHPIHTEVVANIKSRDEILAFLFMILTLFALHHYMNFKKIKHLLITAAFFFLALLSKESSITFIGVLVVVWFFFYREQSSYFLKSTAALLVVTLLFLGIRKTIVGDTISLTPSAVDNLLMASNDSLTRFATAVFILGLYIKLLLIPHPLVFDYSFKQLPLVETNDWRFLVPALLLVSALCFAFFKIKSKTAIVFGILFFFITVSVSSNIFIIIGTNMGERLMYTPSLGFCIIIAALLVGITKADAKADNLKMFFATTKGLTAIVFTIVMLFAVKTIARNAVWKDNYTLYAHDVHLSPESARTHYYLGNYLIKQQNLEGKTQAETDSIIQKGIDELEIALKIFPAFVDARNQLGIVYYHLKNYDKALKCYNDALAYNPNEHTIHNNIGTIYFERNQYELAEQAFRKAVTINPNYFDGYCNLGSVQGTTKKLNEAIQSFNRALEINPNSANVYYFLGLSYQNLGNETEAQRCFEKQKALEGK